MPELISDVCVALDGLGILPGAERGVPIWCTGAEGTESLLFGSAESAVAWLSEHEGLLPLHHVDMGFELDLSIHYHDSILQSEMSSLPDRPHFDVVTVIVSEPAPGARQQVWATLESALTAALVRLRPVYAYGLDEGTTQSLMPFLCVHQRVLEGRLPPFVPWLSAVSSSSALTRQLERQADLMRCPVTSVHGLQLVQFRGTPWDPGVSPTVVNASTRWRDLENDDGCG